jgi:hypothetical protein
MLAETKKRPRGSARCWYGRYNLSPCYGLERDRSTFESPCYGRVRVRAYLCRGCDYDRIPLVTSRSLWPKSVLCNHRRNVNKKLHDAKAVRRTPSVQGGDNTFGLSLLPFIIGIAFLFFDGRSIIGWLLTVAGGVIIFVGILTNLDVYFRPTSLFNTIVMLVLLFDGIGLVARSLRPRRS